MYILPRVRIFLDRITTRNPPRKRTQNKPEDLFSFSPVVSNLAEKTKREWRGNIANTGGREEVGKGRNVKANEEGEVNKGQIHSKWGNIKSVGISGNKN
jgi:hypothetical protein